LVNGARPVYTLEQLRQIDPEYLAYESPKPGPRGSVSLLVASLELIDRLVALIPPSRSPPLWELSVDGWAEQEIEPLAQPTPVYTFDQRIVW
jgi:hypothetical protein